MTRMPTPAHIDRHPHYQTLFHHEASDSPWAGVIVNSVWFGALAVTGALLVSWFFLLFLLIPAAHWTGILQYTRNSKQLYSGHMSGYHTRGLYSLAIEEYRKIHDADTKNRAYQLVQNVFLHESALNEVGKSHKDRSCEPCTRRVGLIGQLANNQRVPGTQTDDIEEIEGFLSVQKEMSELT